MGRLKHRQWWEDEEDYYQSKYGSIYDTPSTYPEDENYSPAPHTHSGYTYKSYFYKKSFDFSVGLETRVKQLIKTISGKDLKLAQANGWGADKDYFYYNPQDLQDATDDEVLGLIFHQLARELFLDEKLLTRTQKADPEYKHLLYALEDSRVDRPMVDKYNGADYYLGTVWESLKKENNKPRPEKNYGWDELGNEVYKTDNPIPAEEFNYNISVLANKQSDYSGYDTAQLAEFTKAIPHIEAYLNSPSMAEALKHYPAIKKHYPKPNSQEQERMDSRQEGMGMGDQEKSQARRNAQSKERAEKGKDMEAQTESLAGKDEQEKLQNFDYARYINTQTAHQQTINALHKLLASILLDNDTKRYLGRQKRGKIDSKSLHKLVTQDSYRIFKRERERQNKQYAFTILIDQSGSMNGQRIDNAFAGAVILAEVFGKLRIPFSIVGFDTSIRTYKNFFSNPRKEVIGGIHNAVGGGTNDRMAIEKMRELNATLPPKYSRSLFVLTDGDGQWSDTQELVNDMTTKDKIKVFGLGLGYVHEESMKRTYPKYAVCQDVTELPNTLIELVREQFIRG